MLGKQHALVAIVLADLVGRGLGGCDEHPVGDALGLGRVDGQAQGRKDVEVVGLSGMEGLAVEGDIRELHAAGDQRLAVGPGIGLLRRALGLVCRVGQREDDRPLDVLGHGLDHAFGEGASRGAAADQDRRLERVHRAREIRRRLGALVRIDLLRRREILARGFDQAVDVEHRHLLHRLGAVETLVDHRFDDHVADADAGRAGAEEEDALILEARLDDLQRGGDGGDSDRSRALDVVVVDEVIVGVARQQPDRVGALPVLEMHADAGEHLVGRRHELVGERVHLVRGGRHLAQPEVERVGAQGGVGGADVEQHR